MPLVETSGEQIPPGIISVCYHKGLQASLCPAEGLVCVARPRLTDETPVVSEFGVSPLLLLAHRLPLQFHSEVLVPVRWWVTEEL